MKKQLLLITLISIAIGGPLCATQNNPEEDKPDTKEEVTKESTQESTQHALAQIVVVKETKANDDIAGENQDKKDQK